MKYKTKLLAVAALTALCANAGDWRELMWEEPVALREGVVLRAHGFSYPRTMKAYVARVNLDTPGLGFVATERAPDWGRPIVEATNMTCFAETALETTSDFMVRKRAEGRNIELAFNTTPWEPFPAPPGCKEGDPLGWCVSDGVEVSRPDSHPLFIVRKDGTADILAAPPAGGLDEVAFAAAAYDLILTNGVDAIAVNRPEDDGLHPRLALGLTPDKRTLIVAAVDGRQDGYSLGADMADLRALMRLEGASDAVNMDGGGSTSLVVWDAKRGKPWMLNRHADGSSRANAVNCALAFDAPPPSLEIERTASVYHSYEFNPVVDTPAPEGFAPFYIAHYGRHGSRRLTDSFVSNTLDALMAAAKNDNLTDEGVALLGDVCKIDDAHEGMIGQLSERGAAEQRQLARRMALRFPEVFKDERRVRCQSGVYHRVLLSQANFTMSLKDAAPGIDFDFITGERFQRLVNGPHWARAEDGSEVAINAAVDAFARATIDPAPLVKRIFRSGDAGRDALRFARDLFTVASDCQCLRTELGGLDIYRYFTQQEIAALSRVLEARHYAGMGCSVEFGDTALAGTRALAQDFVERADEAIADSRIAADLRFGHDSGLWPLAGCLGLEGPGERVPFAESSRLCPAWKWMCMASNLQLVFYRDANGEILVKALYNEREMRIKGLTPLSGPYYRWRDVKEKLES